MCAFHPDREAHIRCQRCERRICPDCMAPASVGFQCPSCVREGAKSVRQPTTPYGGAIPRNAGLTSQAIIAVNAAVWLLILSTGGTLSVWIDRLAISPLGRCIVPGTQNYFPAVDSADLCTRVGSVNGIATEWVAGVASGAPWQLLTSAFTHVDLWHIGLNMLAVWFLGPQLELVLGRVRFLALYLLSALAGSVAVLLLSDPAGQTVGASGAVFGLIGALLVVVVKVGGDPRVLLIWLGINVVITVTGRDFISWQGHLGGFVGGVLAALVLAYAPRPRRTLVQVVGLAVLALLLAGGAVAGALLVA